MSRKMPRAILFDIGRVLVGVDISRAMGSLSRGISLSAEEVWSSIEKDPAWPDWQEGRMTPRDWHLRLCQRLGLELTFDEFRRAWNSALDPQPMQDKTLFEELAKSCRLGLISNTDPLHVEHMESTYDFFAYFPAATRIYSCVAGVSKPDPLIYQRALAASKTSASQAIFIDDVGTYVEAARRLRIRAIHYSSTGDLREKLKELDVKLS